MRFSQTVALVVFGAPRTKKTHNVLRRSLGHGGRPAVFPSAAWRRWVKEATFAELRYGEVLNLPVLPSDAVKRMLWAARIRSAPLHYFPLERPVNCRARFFRDADRGDLLGFEQGLADLLEVRGLITNDRLIVGWDGSVLLVDRARPRVELELEVRA